MIKITPFPFIASVSLLFLIITTASASAQTCSDELIRRFMGAPVETTLKSTRAFYAADNNFVPEILSTKRALIVLVYNNEQDFSQGLAAVVACVHREFPQVRLIAYDVEELSQRGLDRAAHFTGGMIKSIPSLFLYRHTNGKLELAATIHEGYRELELIKKQIQRVSEFIQNKMFP